MSKADETIRAFEQGAPGTARLVRLEGDRPEVGGLAIAYPSGDKRTIAWQSLELIHPPLDAAKRYAAKLVDERMRAGNMADVDRTNWVSVTAAIERIIREWNARLHAAREAKLAVELAKGPAKDKDPG